VHSLVVDNVNTALSEGLILIHTTGIEENSRNGKVLVMEDPVCTTYTRPWERVLFSPTRDANPFFHLMEAIWMLAGRNDIIWPVYFNSRFKEYSDDGITQWAAYGKRWRSWFGYDQLMVISEELQKNPNSRRCVLAMWDAVLEEGCENKGDLNVAIAGGRDVPCNTHAYFDARGGKLNMTVSCRSNDILWGAYGANAVHFSLLQEVMAKLVGIPMGVYRQISCNYHLYTEVIPRDKIVKLASDKVNMYEMVKSPLEPTITNGEAFLRDCEKFVDFYVKYISWEPGRELPEPVDLEEPFFRDTAVPMFMAYYLHKNKHPDALKARNNIAAWDWGLAAGSWLEKRIKIRMEKQIKGEVASVG